MKPGSVSSARFVIATQFVTWIVAACFLVLAPAAMTSFFAPSTTPFTITLARIFGSELTGLALVSWITRNTNDPVTLRGLVLCYFTCNLLGFVCALYGRTSGALRETGWLLVGLYLLYALLFAYLRFVALTQRNEG